MTTRRLAFVLVAVAAAFSLAAAAVVPAGAAEANVLVATVGPDFTIKLEDTDGKLVRSAPAGKYTLVVHDLSAEHNFVLANKPDGQRVRIDSGVEFIGDKTFEVDLAVGNYTYACSPHWQTMNGQLVVFPDVKPPTAKPKPAAKPKPKKKKKRR
jgi:plastocyanin